MWKQIDQYHIRNGEWTITKSANVPLPYGLWHIGKMIGNYKTSDEAKREYERLMNEEATIKKQRKSNTPRYTS